MGLPDLVPLALAFAMPERTRSTMIERSNSAKYAQHLKHCLAGGRRGVERLLKQEQLDASRMHLLQERDQVFE